MASPGSADPGSADVGNFPAIFTEINERYRLEQAQDNAEHEQQLADIEKSVRATTEGIVLQARDLVQRFMAELQGTVETSVTTAVASQVNLRLGEAKLKKEHDMRKTSRSEKQADEFHSVLCMMGMPPPRGSGPRRKTDFSLTPGPKESTPTHLTSQPPITQNRTNAQAKEDEKMTPAVSRVKAPATVAEEDERVTPAASRAEAPVAVAEGDERVTPAASRAEAPAAVAEEDERVTPAASRAEAPVAVAEEDERVTPAASRAEAPAAVAEETIVPRDEGVIQQPQQPTGTPVYSLGMKRMNSQIAGGTQEKMKPVKKRKAERRSPTLDRSKRPRTQDSQQSEQNPVPQEPRPSRATSTNSSPRALRTSQKLAQRTITFGEVYQNGNPKYKHLIVEFEKGSGDYYILRCDEHGVHFGANPLHGAAKHLYTPEHNMCSKTYVMAVEKCGTLVTGHTPELIEQNNAMFAKAIAQGYKPLNAKMMSKARRDVTLEDLANAESAPPRTPIDGAIHVTDSPKGISPTKGHKRQPSMPDPTLTPKMGRSAFQGITSPTPCGFYLGYWASTKKWYPVIILPLNDDGSLNDIGLRYNIRNTKLLNDIPKCYNHTVGAKGTRKITGYAKGYEDGGPNVTKREFPVMYFDNKDRKGMSLGWLGAKNLKPIDFDDSIGRANYPGFDDAKQWFAELKKRETYNEYKEQGTGPSSPAHKQGEDESTSVDPDDLEAAINDMFVNGWNSVSPTDGQPTRSVDDDTKGTDDTTKSAEDPDPMTLDIGPLPEDEDDTNYVEPGSAADSEEESDSDIEMPDQDGDEDDETDIDDHQASKPVPVAKGASAQEFAPSPAEKTRSASHVVNGLSKTLEKQTPKPPKKQKHMGRPTPLESSKVVSTSEPASHVVSGPSKTFEKQKHIGRPTPLESSKVVSTSKPASHVVSGPSKTFEKQTPKSPEKQKHTERPTPLESSKVVSASKLASEPTSAADTVRGLAAAGLSASSANILRAKTAEPKKLASQSAKDVSQSSRAEDSPESRIQSTLPSNGQGFSGNKATVERRMSVDKVVQKDSVPARPDLADNRRKSTAETLREVALQASNLSTPRAVQPQPRTPSLPPRHSTLPPRPNVVQPGESLARPRPDVNGAASQRPGMSMIQPPILSPPIMSPPIMSPSMGPPRSHSSTPVQGLDSRRSTPTIVRPDPSNARWQAIRTNSTPQSPQSAFATPASATATAVALPATACDTSSREQSTERRGPSISSLMSPPPPMLSPAYFAIQQGTPSAVKPNPNISGEQFYVDQYRDSTKRFERANADEPYLRIAVNARGVAETASTERIHVTIDPGSVKSIVSDVLDKAHTAVRLTLKDGGEQYLVFVTNSATARGAIGGKIQARTFVRWLRKLNTVAEYENKNSMAGEASGNSSVVTDAVGERRYIQVD